MANINQISPDGGTTVYDIEDPTARSGVNSLTPRVGIAEGKITTLQEQMLSVQNSLDDLGTASTKNSTSVVTDSSDLVESGAVYDALGWGNKNLLPNIAVSGGLAVVNSDGSVLLNGSQSSTFYLTINNIEVSDLEDNVNYTFSGCPSGGASDTYNITLFDTRLALRDTGSGVTFNKSTFTGTIQIFIRIEANYVCNNLLFRPQLEVGTTATAYEPYHASVEETIPQVVSDAAGWDIGNLIGIIEQGGFDSNGLNTSSDQRVRNKEYIPVKGGAQYIISGTVNNAILQCLVSFYTVNDYTTPRIDSTQWFDTPVKVTVPSNAKYIRVIFKRKVDANLTPSDINNGAIIHCTVDEQKADNSVIGTVEDGTTASQAYAVGSHAIRNGAFITWKNAKAQGETINDASDYTSGDVADCLIKQGTYSGTTSANGNIYLTNVNIVIIGIKSSTGAYVGVPYSDNNGNWYLHFTEATAAGNVVAETNVNGKYYYI